MPNDSEKGYYEEGRRFLILGELEKFTGSRLPKERGLTEHG